MANNYMEGTIWPSLPLTETQRSALCACPEDLRFAKDEELLDGEKLFVKWQETYGLEESTGISVDIDTDDLYYLYCENGMEAGADEVLQEILRGLPEDKYTCITFEAASYCSKMRPDEFGGVACFITRDEIKWMSTSDWLYKCKNEVTNAAK